MPWGEDSGSRILLSAFNFNDEGNCGHTACRTKAGGPEEPAAVLQEPAHVPYLFGVPVEKRGFGAAADPEVRRGKWSRDSAGKRGSGAPTGRIEGIAGGDRPDPAPEKRGFGAQK